MFQLTSLRNFVVRFFNEKKFNLEHLAQHIEGLIFTSPQPLSVKDIQSCLEETFETNFPDTDIKSALNSIRDRYSENDYAFEVIAISGGYQFMTKGAYHKTIGTLLKQTTKKQLSRAALETLSIVAYKQPVTKTEVEKIRGVSCDYAMQKLLEKELVDITGRSEGPGRPLLYATSEKFMDYFGLASISELPKPKDFRLPDNVVGEAAPIEESMLVEVDEASGIQIGNLNLPPTVVLDMKGQELVIRQLDPVMENAVGVIATGVGLFDDETTQPPKVVLPTPTAVGTEKTDTNAIEPGMNNQVLDDAVAEIIAVAGIFDEIITTKEVPRVPDSAIIAKAARMRQEEE